LHFLTQNRSDRSFSGWDLTPGAKQAKNSIMKSLFAISGLSLCFCIGSIQAAPHMGGMGGGMASSPRITKAMEKLFGDNSAYTATLELEQANMKMPGKVAFDQGKSRFEMDIAQAKGTGLGAESTAQMKQMGMDRMVAITRPDKRTTYMIYPGMEAYLEQPIEDAQLEKMDEYKVQVTELGTETVNGHPTVKNKAVITDGKQAKYEATVWNAKDLKNFPVKIQHTQEGVESTLYFKDVKLAKPDASLFEPPAKYKKYSNMQELMQQEIMKRMGIPGGMPPGAMPPRKQQ
jgi:hypothetical protein